DTLKAEKLYEIAFKKVNVEFERDIYYYSVCLWKNGKQSEALQLLDTSWRAKFAINMSGHFSTVLQTQLDSFFLNRENKMALIEERMAQNQLVLLVNEMNEKDRQIRIKRGDHEKNFPNDSLGLAKLESETIKVDSLNELMVDSLISIH